MHRTTPVESVLCAGLCLIAACNSDSPTAASPTASFATTSLSTPNGSCNQPGHPSGSILDTVQVPLPWGVAVRDDGLTYFTELLNGGVGITSTKTRTVDGFIPTGQVPTGVAFSPDGGTAYVANQDATVSVINVATATRTGTISTNGMAAFAVQVSPDGSTLFVGGSGSVVEIIDTQSGLVVNSVDAGFAVNAFAVAPDNRILYASAFGGGTVTEIDMFTQTPLRTFAVGGTPQGLALNRKGTHLYIGNEAGYLNDVDLATGQIGANITLTGGAFGVGVTPDDNQAYIAIPSQGRVQIFGLQNRKLVGSLSVGGQPRRIAFSQLGKIGAVTNANGFLSFVR
jgi:YVTN family beta-propeller protein